MGKFIYSVMAVVMIELSLWLFAGSEYANTTVFGFLFNISELNLFYLAIYGAIALTATIGIVASSVAQLNIYGVYSGVALAALTFFLSIAHLYSFVYGELSAVLSIQFAQILAILITAPLLITYSLAVMEWVRSN